MSVTTTGRSVHDEIMAVVAELEAKTGRRATRDEWRRILDYFGELKPVNEYLAAKAEEGF